MPFSAMDATDSKVTDFSVQDWTNAGTDDFLSFSDDVSKRAASFGDVSGLDDDQPVRESCPVLGEVEQDRESMVSPTTAASVEHMVLGNDTNAVVHTSTVVANDDTDAMNFQNAFQ